VSIVAGSSAYLDQADDTPRGWRALVFHPVALGVLLGTALTIFLGHWIVSQAQTDAATDRWNRGVLVELMALADAAGAIEADDKKGASEKLSVLLTTLPGAEDGAATYRVLRLSGARLLASTQPNDVGDMAPPRRLSRDEKWLFDLAQALRASVQTQRDEGIYRRRQVEVEEIDGGLVRVSVPYFVGDKVAGLVQTERRRSGVSVSGNTTLAVGLVLAAYLLTIGALIAVGRERREKDAALHKPWALFGIGLVLLAASAMLHGRIELAHLSEAYTGLTRDLAAQFVTVKERVAFLAGEAGVSIAPGLDNRWDVDLFRRPIGIIDGDGQVRSGALADKLGDVNERLGGGLRWNWAFGLVVLLFFGLGYARRLRRTVRDHKSAYFYVMPAMIGMMVLAFFPFGYGILLSFSGQTVLNVGEPLSELMVGFQNYVSILGDFRLFETTAEGAVINYQNFYWTMFITVCWTISNVTVGVTLGVLLALTLNTKGLKYTNIYRVLLILPWAIPNYITALIWKGMFHQQFGVINQAIQMFGGTSIAWFDGVFSSFMTGLITNGWLSFPFMMVITLGALQSIPADLYEAATIDGATRWQQFKHVTLPSLKPTLIPAIIISVVWTFNMFNVIYLVSGGAPAGANEILITKSYKIAFEEYRYGYAAAYSVVIFFMLMFYGVFQTRMTKATEAANA
jgi:arabinogalactan oligomer/maltooligosaccharide transport system permease protein